MRMVDGGSEGYLKLVMSFFNLSSIYQRTLISWSMHDIIWLMESLEKSLIPFFAIGENLFVYYLLIHRFLFFAE